MDIPDKDTIIETLTAISTETRNLSNDASNTSAGRDRAYVWSEAADIMVNLLSGSPAELEMEPKKLLRALQEMRDNANSKIKAGLLSENQRMCFERMARAAYVSQEFFKTCRDVTPT